jgi:hypothetical protein
VLDVLDGVQRLRADDRREPLRDRPALNDEGAVRVCFDNSPADAAAHSMSRTIGGGQATMTRLARTWPRSVVTTTWSELCRMRRTGAFSATSDRSGPKVI